MTEDRCCESGAFTGMHDGLEVDFTTLIAAFRDTAYPVSSLLREAGPAERWGGIEWQVDASRAPVLLSFRRDAWSLIFELVEA